jgi:hypothetical protein
MLFASNYVKTNDEMSTNFQMIEEMIGDSVPLKLTIEDLREMGCYAR